MVSSGVQDLHLHGLQLEREVGSWTERQRGMSAGPNSSIHHRGVWPRVGDGFFLADTNVVCWLWETSRLPSERSSRETSRLEAKLLQAIRRQLPVHLPPQKAGFRKEDKNQIHPMPAPTVIAQTVQAEYLFLLLLNWIPMEEGKLTTLETQFSVYPWNRLQQSRASKLLLYLSSSDNVLC